MTIAVPTVADVQRIAALDDPVLRNLQITQCYHELAALLQEVDPTPDSPQGSGAQDWGHLPDRMHFIVDLFRAYHLDPRLFNPPFSPPQVGQLKGGRLPQGAL